jgi:hypothetical protein
MAVVKFHSKASAEIVMLQSHAEKLFSIMGLELAERGVITHEGLSGAIANLSAAVLQEKMAQAEMPPLTEDEEAAQPRGMGAPVSLHQRAYPLLKMMQDALQKKADIHWGF